MPSGRAVEFDLICPKVREDGGGLQHLLHLSHGINSSEGGGRQRWAVSALMGLQKLSNWGLTCFMDAAEQQPNSLPGEMLSFTVTATQPEDRSSQAQTIVMATAMAFVHKTVSSLGWGRYFFTSVSVSDEA